jgi:hypothetical protein
MDLIAEHGILSLLIRNLSLYHALYSPGCLFFLFGSRQSNLRLLMHNLSLYLSLYSPG